MASRRKLSERDKKMIAGSQKWKCGKCYIILPSTYQIDHVIPYSISMDDSFDNLEALCPNCHSSKTQKEFLRIIEFKKYRSLKNNINICWYCLNPEILHECSKKFEKISFKSLYNKNEIILFDKYNFIEDKNSYSDKLLIELYPNHIKINNFEFKEDYKIYGVKSIGECILKATRTKKDSNRYSEIEITFNLEQDDIPDELIDHLEKEIMNYIPKRILKTKNINLVFIT